MNARTSVVIPTYNRAAAVLRAVDSVLAQTMPALEILVVDDGSTDDTARVVGTLPPPVRYLRKANGGVSSARNLGIEQARGEFVAFLDSDDRWDPNWIAEATRALDGAPDLGCVTATVQFVYPDGAPAGTHDLGSQAIEGRLPFGAMVRGRVGANLFVRRQVLQRVGNFDESLSTGEDYDLGLRLFAESGIAWVPAPMFLVTRNRDSLSGNINTGNRLRVLDKFERLHTQFALRHRQDLKEVRARTALNYALDLTVARRLGEARQRVAESWRHEPSRAAALQWLKIAVLKLLGKDRA